MSLPTVLSVVNQFPAPSETFVLRKLTALRAEGYRVAVAASTFLPGARETGFDLVPLTPWRDPRASWSVLGGTGSAGAVGGLVRSQLRRSAGTARPRRLLLAPLKAVGADIVHFEFSGIAVSYRDLLDELEPARLVVSCRGSAEAVQPLLDPSRAEALSAVLRRVDLVHCVSDAMARTVGRYGADPQKVLVERPAVPVADLAPLADQRAAHGGPLRVLSIGRLQWVKGFDDALRAIARLVAAGHPVEYRIVGEGPDREKLTFLIDELGLGDSVELLGVQTQAQVRDQLVWADAMLLSSLSEGISNAVLEAMAVGLPVVSTDCGGMSEVIKSGTDGFIVPVADVSAMAEQLGKLADDLDLRRTIGRAAAERAAASFDLERQVHGFVTAYGRLLSRS